MLLTAQRRGEVCTMRWQEILPTVLTENCLVLNFLCAERTGFH
jgi:hypothetical protein